MRYNRKKKSTQAKREVITEPTRKSILDVVETNLRIAERITFLHRLMYIGQYHFEDGDSISNAMENNYEESNTGYIPEPLSGILLYYNNYFCYIVEAPERVLNKHLSLLFDKYGSNLIKVKLLSAIHHIKGRFWKEWMSYYGKPPERVEEIDPNSDLENSMWYVKDCCGKLYKFANAFITDQMKLRNRQQFRSEFLDDDFEEAAAAHKSKTIIVERDAYSDFLPEVKLLDFLVNCKHLKDLKQYHRYYEYIGQSMDFSRKAWPAPTTMIPYNVFDEPYDPVEDLPTATQVQPSGEEVHAEAEEINAEPGENNVENQQ